MKDAGGRAACPKVNVVTVNGEAIVAGGKCPFLGQRSRWIVASKLLPVVPVLDEAEIFRRSGRQEQSNILRRHRRWHRAKTLSGITILKLPSCSAVHRLTKRRLVVRPAGHHARNPGIESSNPAKIEAVSARTGKRLQVFPRSTERRMTPFEPETQDNRDWDTLGVRRKDTTDSAQVGVQPARFEGPPLGVSSRGKEKANEE
jgi:hypothetical protein